MIYTTLNKIRAHSPCSDGWEKLLRHLGKTKADDEPLGFDVILKSNGLDDALWCLRTVPDESRRWRHLALRFASTVKHLMTDRRSLAALDVAQRHADGLASDVELKAALAAARAAARDAAWDAAQEAAWAATVDAALAAARAAARDAAWDAAWEAAQEAAWAAGAATVDAALAAARAAARDAAWDAAQEAAWAAQSEIFLDTLNDASLAPLAKEAA